MTQYQKYLKDWTSERGITSFLGSDKPAFQRDWKEEKSAPARFGEEMGREDINRAGEPFKKPKPKQSIFEGMTEKEKILTRAMIAYYKEQDDDFEAFYREDKRGNPVEIKGAFKELTDSIAKKFKLPKTFVKQGDAVMSKYRLTYGLSDESNKTEMYRY